MPKPKQQERDARIVKAYNNGFSTNAIRATFNLTHRYVQTILEKAGVRLEKAVVKTPAVNKAGRPKENDGYDPEFNYPNFPKIITDDVYSFRMGWPLNKTNMKTPY